MEKKLENPKAQDVSTLRKDIGQSEKKVLNSAQEFSIIPESGVFAKIGTKEFDIPNVGKRTSLGLFTQTDDFVSENTIFSSSVTDELTKIENGTNKGKFMLKQERNNPALYKLGKSQDLRLIGLIGKSFTTTDFQGKTLKSYDANDMFAESDSTASLKKLQENVEAKKMFRFEI